MTNFIEEIFVMKQLQLNGKPRYRYRIQGEDYGKPYLNSLDAFKFKYSKNMNEEDIEQVEQEWEMKLVKENYVN